MIKQTAVGRKKELVIDMACMYVIPGRFAVRGLFFSSGSAAVIGRIQFMVVVVSLLLFFCSGWYCVGCLTFTLMYLPAAWKCRGAFLYPCLLCCVWFWCLEVVGAGWMNHSDVGSGWVG